MGLAGVMLAGDMQLPIKIPFDLMLTKWSSILNPFLANPLNNMSILKDVAISSTATTQVAHKLGRIPKGFVTVDITDSGVIYRTQASDINFIYLRASSDMTVSIGVF